MSETKLNPEVNALVKALRDQVTVSKDGEVTVGKEAYASTLEQAGLDQKTVRQVYDHNLNVVAAAGVVFGEAGIAAMKGKKDLDRLVAKIPTVGRDSIDLTLDRKSTGRNPRTGEETVSFGRLSAGYTSYGTRNRGMFADVKKMISSAAEEAFGK